jgi:hypothetical protein
MSPSNLWPALAYDDWRDTYATLHLWLQIVGKIALTRSPWTNHSWHVTLLVSARGLTTRLLPHGNVSFQIELDFIDHAAVIRGTAGRTARIPLPPQTTANFYRQVMDALRALGLPVAIHTLPNELPDAIPFDRDDTHCAYDPLYAQRYWHALVQSARVFETFRARFIGKASPVHFFWGSADLAVTRFSGRTAPEHPGGIPNLPDWVAREAYLHEVSSAGFWAGSAQYPQPVFYSYAYPEPLGFADAVVRPNAARYDAALREFVLPYAAVSASPTPEVTLLEFLQSTFDATASLAHWDTAALTRSAAYPPGASATQN